MSITMLQFVVGLAIAVAMPTLMALLGILVNRRDAKELRADIAGLRNDMNKNFFEFYRTLGQHDAA